MRLKFKLVDFESSRLSVMSVGHIQSVEGLNRTKDQPSLSKMEFCSR